MIPGGAGGGNSYSDSSTNLTPSSSTTGAVSFGSFGGLSINTGKSNTPAILLVGIAAAAAFWWWSRRR